MIRLYVNRPHPVVKQLLYPRSFRVDIDRHIRGIHAPSWIATMRVGPVVFALINHKEV